MIAETQATQTVMPYDENLLERTRTQWQFGDWDSLAKLEQDTIRHHPDRAKLALLAAAGQFQAGDMEAGRHYIRLAQDWGCGDALVMQVLAAGAAQQPRTCRSASGQSSACAQTFRERHPAREPGSDSRLVLRARAHEQFAQLGLALPETANDIRGARPSGPRSFRSDHSNEKSPIAVDVFFSETEGDRAKAVDAASQAFTQQWAGWPTQPMDWVRVEHRGNPYFFIHFSGDYIPKKMAEKGQFYESPYLNLLARLHQPGKLIVDGGANIGNHAVFFGGAMGASVVAFEPQPFNYGCLLANTYLNHLAEQVDVRRIALGEQVGRIELTQALQGNYGSFTADASLVKPGDEGSDRQEPFEVSVSTLDAELAGCHDAVSIIKLDLEGMELAALRGARAVIEKSLPVIAVECFTRTMYQEIKDFLTPLEYFVIDSTNATPTFIFSHAEVQVIWRCCQSISRCLQSGSLPPAPHLTIQRYEEH
ncbi:FkbM family methyltransferase [Achromobacter insuavis]